MVRLVIQITEEQAILLKAISAARKVSVAALVREGVDTVLSKEEKKALWDRALAALGSCPGNDGVTDVALNHDKYLADAWGA